MVIGRPPFQTSDVKEIYQFALFNLYRNIKENNYTFPATVPISSEMKSLISSLLCSVPENRPKIEDLLKMQILKAETERFQSMSLKEPSSSGMIDKMFSNLSKFFDPAKKLLIEAIEWEDPSCYIEKWVDCSGKYGVGYVLTNGILGVNFNDSSSIIMSPNQKYFDYLEQEVKDNRKLIIKETFECAEDPPEKLFKKTALLKYFQSYLDFKPSHSEGSERKDLDFLIKYMKTKHAIVFRLSNRMIQFNFFDQTRLLFYKDGNLVILITAENETSQHSLYKLARSPDAEVVQRLRYVHSILSSLLTKRESK